MPFESLLVLVSSIYCLWKIYLTIDRLIINLKHTGQSESLLFTGLRKPPSKQCIHLPLLLFFIKPLLFFYLTDLFLFLSLLSVDFFPLPRFLLFYSPFSSFFCLFLSLFEFASLVLRHFFPRGFLNLLLDLLKLFHAPRPWSLHDFLLRSFFLLLLNFWLRLRGFLPHRLLLNFDGLLLLRRVLHYLFWLQLLNFRLHMI